MNPTGFKNIQEFPQVIQPAITAFSLKLLEALDDRLESLLVYGSAVGANYHHGTSNINFAVLLKGFDFALLKKSVACTQWGRKNRIATPLFLTKDYVLGSLDVFPLEYSEIKRQHRVVFGEDFFQGLDIPLRDIRLFCEQQVKGKALHLRQAYVSVAPDGRALKNFLIGALDDLMPVFRHLLILKGRVPLEGKEQLLAQLAGEFSLEEASLLAVYQDKHKKSAIGPGQVEGHLQNFLGQLEALSHQIDSL